MQGCILSLIRFVLCVEGDIFPQTRWQPWWHLLTPSLNQGYGFGFEGDKYSRTKDKYQPNQVCIKGKNVEGVDQFVYPAADGNAKRRPLLLEGFKPSLTLSSVVSPEYSGLIQFRRATSTGNYILLSFLTILLHLVHCIRCEYDFWFTYQDASFQHFKMSGYTMSAETMLLCGGGYHLSSGFPI